MDCNEACKRSCERENSESGKIAEANIESYESGQEEGEIREVYEPPRLESFVLKGTAASVEQQQVHMRQSASPPRASHKGESAGTVVLQQQSTYGAIHKDMSASIVHSFVQDAIEKEQVNIRPSTSPERGSHQGRIPCIIFVQESKYSAIQEDMAATPSISSQGVVEDEPSASAERGFRIRETASTAVVQQSKYTASEDRHVNVRKSTSRRLCGNHRQSYSSSVYISSKERHKKRKEGCFRYSDSRWVLKMIEDVCSQRFSALLSRQNGDRKKLKIGREKLELEFFQKHVHCYKVHHAHVRPTMSYCRMMLPKLHFSSLRNRFHKHMKSQMLKFVKLQVSDRNKENRIKERWIFEAKAGYLKKLFYATSLSYSEFKLEKLECHMTDYSEGEEHLKYFDMQSLTTQIEVIASNKEPEGIFASDVTEPILEKTPSPLETNGPTKSGFSVGAAGEITTLESRSSQSTCALTMEFGEKNGTQTTLFAAAQNDGENIERPYACQLDTIAALEPANAVTTGKSSDVSEPMQEHSPLQLVTNGATQLGFSVGVSEERATSECSSQLTCAPGMEFGEKDGMQIAFSVAEQNDGENMESPCASRFVTSSTSELDIAVTNDTGNAARISGDKRRRISSDNDMSEGPCCMSGRKFGEKDGTEEIALSTTAQNEERDMERSCASHSDKDASLGLAMTTNTDSENTLPGSNEKQMCISSGNNISEGPCSGSQEPSAARAPPPLVNNSQMIQAEDTGGEEVHSGQISSFAQVTDQPNMHSNTQSVMNMNHCGSISQVASHPYQAPGGNTHSARTEVDSLGASHAPASDTQLPTGSTPGQILAEDGPNSNVFTIELNRLHKLHGLIAKRHEEKREQLILARQVEMAQAKKKYDALVYNSEVEVLERRRELKITCDKIYKQQILAEVLQVIYKASAKVVPDSSRGAAQKSTAEPNRSSDQRSFQFTTPVSAPASASIYQSPQMSVQTSTDASLRQHRVTAQHTYMDSSGTNLMNYPSGGMGLAYRRQA
uniref:Uncharacterized protein n=1 Tax=Avena sativa TaxID=4498 RepID=A0ACD5Z2C9_AVESA